jgi:hypothetical protein
MRMLKLFLIYSLPFCVNGCVLSYIPEQLSRFVPRERRVSPPSPSSADRGRMRERPLPFASDVHSPILSLSELLQQHNEDEATDEVDWQEKEKEKEKKCELPMVENTVEDEICCICLSKIARKRLAIACPCCHKFCFHCIKTWLLVKKTCPLCNLDVNTIMHHISNSHQYSMWSPKRAKK